MASECGCGRQVSNAFHSFGCLDCGAPLCPACAISLESATYCAGCAADLLGTRTVRASGTFDLR